jgi:1-pyrroline-5-carboxylate dehydrogenase
VRGYAAGSPERLRLEATLIDLVRMPLELPQIIGGRPVRGEGAAVEVVQPHRHGAVLGSFRSGTSRDALTAVSAARDVAPEWRSLSFDDRAAVFLRAADLLAGPWRETLVAATMLGQSKTAHQAEIDAACELADFWRFNVHFARQLLADQPRSPRGEWNRTDHRPLEGFTYAVTPFNFTAIAGNLPTAPALMGNTVVWKPSPTQQFAAHFTMELLAAAGLPAGVINMVTGYGPEISDVLLDQPDLAAIHFTGSTPVFQELWRSVGNRISSYAGYPRLVGETGGKNFVVAHPSADPEVLLTALIRGAFEYQGQKCSAASRAYLPRSLWNRISGDLADRVASLPMGDVTDFKNFLGAVIDRRSFRRLSAALDRAQASSSLEVLVGGGYDDTEGFFVEPTVLVGTDPTDEAFTTEYFGPILSVYVYDDAAFDEILPLVESGVPYGLTGAVLATDREALARATTALRFAAGNFYLNDKPTGAVVGQQPFGGGRASGTNDKAGSMQNLLRWVSTRSIKENFVPPTDYRYPHMS